MTEPSRRDMAKATIRIVDLSAVLHSLLLALEQLPHGPGHARDPEPAVRAVVAAAAEARAVLYDGPAAEAPAAALGGGQEERLGLFPG